MQKIEEFLSEWTLEKQPIIFLLTCRHKLKLVKVSVVIKVVTCLESCSSQSLYKTKNFWARITFSWKPQLASFTLIMICLSGTIMATVLNCTFKFSGSSWRPAYPGFYRHKCSSINSDFITNLRSIIKHIKLKLGLKVVHLYRWGKWNQDQCVHFSTLNVY